MPHQIVEYSANLERRVDIDALLRLLHETVAGMGVFTRAALRTRAARRDRYYVADGDPDNCFVHVLLRVDPGRSMEVKHDAGERLFEALCDFLQPILATTPIGLSLEIQEIDPALRWRVNNLAGWLEKRGSAP